MEITVGTFNLNNLFSRYNFEAEIDALPAGGPDLGGTVEYKFAPGSIRLRTYLGRLVKAKDPTATQKITDRIRTMSADVLAVQEVEDIDTLRQFNRDWLNNLYPYVTLIEGNDPRLIDVGVLSKLPVGGVTSWQHARHAADPAQPVFGRDLIEVEILNDARTKNCSRCSILISRAISSTSGPIRWWAHRPTTNAAAGRRKPLPPSSRHAHARTAPIFSPAT